MLIIQFLQMSLPPICINALCTRKGGVVNFKLFFLIAGLLLGFSVCEASNYPPDYCHQKVRVLHQGPMLFAQVASGCGSTLVMGYKKSGVLYANHKDSINAVITASCTLNGTSHSQTTTVQLGKEWHGTGYLTTDLNVDRWKPYECFYVANMEYAIAFVDRDGNWDSRNSENYKFRLTEVTMSENYFDTKEDATYGVNLKAWDYIIGEMAK
jgi:hypothetical protein